MKEGLGGPAVLAACHVLAHRLGITASDRSVESKNSAGVEFGRYAVRLAERNLLLQQSAARMLSEVRRALVQALFMEGSLDEAMTELGHNLELGRSCDDDDIRIGALLDIGTLAANDPDPRRAEEALSALSEEDQKEHAHEITRMSITHTRSRLLRRLGRTSEAAASHQQAVEIAARATISPERIRAEIHDMGALLARDMAQGTEVFENAMAALKIRRGNTGDRVDSRFMQALSETGAAPVG
jgi:hypothetical protein